MISYKIINKIRLSNKDNQTYFIKQINFKNSLMVLKKYKEEKIILNN